MMIAKEILSDTTNLEKVFYVIQYCGMVIL